MISTWLFGEYTGGGTSVSTTVLRISLPIQSGGANLGISSSPGLQGHLMEAVLGDSAFAG